MGGVGGPYDFGVSPSPFGLDFGTSDFGLGLDNYQLESTELRILLVNQLRRPPFVCIILFLASLS